MDDDDDDPNRAAISPTKKDEHCDINKNQKLDSNIGNNSEANTNSSDLSTLVTPKRGRGRPKRLIFPNTPTPDDVSLPKRSCTLKNAITNSQVKELEERIIELNNQLVKSKKRNTILNNKIESFEVYKELKSKDIIIDQLQKKVDDLSKEILILNTKIESLVINNNFLVKSNQVLESNISNLKDRSELKEFPDSSKQILDLQKGLDLQRTLYTEQILKLKNSYEMKEKSYTNEIFELKEKLKKNENSFNIKKVAKNAENMKQQSLKHRALEVNKFITETQGISSPIKSGIIKQLVKNECPNNIYLNAEEVAEMQVTINLTYSQTKKLTSFFKSKNKWISLRNEDDVRSIKNKISNELFNIEDWNVDEKLLEVNDGTYKYFGYAIVKSFNDYFFKILNLYLCNNELYFPPEWPSNTINVVIYGDHGRGTVGPSGDGTYKEAFVIVNAVLNERANMNKFHIHGIFGGKDNYQNLSSFLGPIHDELSSLNNYVYEHNNTSYTIKINVLFDLARLSTEFGHQGHSSTFPSVIDYVNINHLRKHPNHPHTPEHCKEIKKRDPESYFLNYDNTNILSGAKNLKSQGKHNGSISEYPLMKIANINQIMLPFLHLQMGITMVIFTQMKEELVKCSSNTDKDTSSYELIDNLENQIISIEGESLSHSKQLSIISRIMQSFNLQSTNLIKYILNYYPKFKLKDYNKKVCKYCHNIFKNCKCKCSSPCCFIRWPDFFNQEIEFIKCSKCYKSVHSLCDPNYLLEFKTNYICLICNKDSIDMLINSYKMVHSELQNNQKSLITNLTKLKGDLTKLKNEYINKQCDSITKLNNLLRSIKVEPQAYHGGDFNGKDIWKIIKNHNILYKEFPLIESKFKPIFTTLEKISRIVSKPSMLSEQELNEFEHLCNNIGLLFFKNFPDRSITPKLHELVFNLPHLLKEYKCYRPFFAIEQQGESIHRAFAEKLHKNSLITSKGKRIFFSLKELSLKSKFQ